MKNSIKRVQSESSLSALLSARILRKAKLRLTLLAAIPLLMGLTSCQQEEYFAPQGGEVQEIRIATRSADNTGATETYTEDFTLELWNGGTYTTHQMTYTEGIGWNTIKVKKLSASVAAFAHKGNSVTDVSYTDEWNYTVNLQLDQSDATKLADADVMIATGSANAGSPLDLNFQHYYAKVTFNVELASEFYPGIDEISRFDVVTCDGDYVKPYVDGNSYTAVIPANPYFKAGVHFALVTINGKKLEVEIPDEYANPNGSFVAGKHYTFDLKVGKDKVTLTPATTDTDFPGGWSNDSEVDLN